MLRIMFLYVLLLFTISNTTSAQNTTLVDIKAQAEKDARADMDKTFWHGIGMCVGGISCIGCILVGLTTGKDPYNDGSNQFPNINVWGGITTGVGGVTALPLITYQIKTTVPASKLLGKSAEYIETYSVVYQSTIRKERVKHSCLGAVVGTFFTAWFLRLSIR